MTMKVSKHDDALEHRDQAERQSEAHRLVAETMKNAWDLAPTWRARFEDAGLDREDLLGADVLKRLDVLMKTDLPGIQKLDPPFGGLATKPAHEFPRIFMSPGPIYDPQLGESDIGGFARGLRMAGFTSDDIVLNTFSYHLTPAGHAFESGAREIGATVIPAGFGNTEQQVDLVGTFDVTAYVGTPSFLALLVGRAEWQFRRACVSGEKMTEHERTQLESRGGSVSQVYGTADLGYLAGECEARDGLHLTEEAHIEILDHVTGEQVADGKTGQIVVTTFSKEYPMFRFGTGDLTQVISSDPCICGRTSTRIAGVTGRVGSGVKVRGMFVYEHDVSLAAEDCGLESFQLAVQRLNGQDQLLLRVGDDCAVDRDLAVAVAFRSRIKLSVRLTRGSQIGDDAAVLVDERDIWKS